MSMKIKIMLAIGIAGIIVTFTVPEWSPLNMIIKVVENG